MKKNRKTRSSEVSIDRGSIEKRTTVTDSIVNNTYVCWSILKYDELKDRVIYYQKYVSNYFCCVFKLIKMEKTLYLALRCNFANRPGSFQLSTDHLTPPYCPSKEIVSGLYVGQFAQSVVSSPDGDFAQTGELKVVFQFVPEDAVVRVRCHEEHFKVGDMSDVDILCSDIREMYLQGRDSDFVINAEGISFKVHKYILYARSNFFRNFLLCENPPSEYTVDTNPGIMHVVLLYCYSGELPDLETDVLRAILSVASKLEISSLEDRCQEDLNNSCLKSLDTNDKITKESPSG